MSPYRSQKQEQYPFNHATTDAQTAVLNKDVSAHDDLYFSAEYPGLEVPEELDCAAVFNPPTAVESLADSLRRTILSVLSKLLKHTMWEGYLWANRKGNLYPGIRVRISVPVEPASVEAETRQRLKAAEIARRAAKGWERTDPLGRPLPQQFTPSVHNRKVRTLKRDTSAIGDRLPNSPDPQGEYRASVLRASGFVVNGK